MRKKNKSGPFIFNIFFNLVTLGIAIMVMQFMNDLASHPQCKTVDPITREGIAGYSWLIIFLSALSAIVNMYIVIMI